MTAPLPDNALLEAAKILTELNRRRETNKLAYYQPYEKQKEFHAKGATHRERLFRAGNQCITPWTYIETPGGLRLAGEMFFSGPSSVVSWAGEQECVALLRDGFLKGIEQAFRFVLDTGEFFDCSANHQVLTESGYLPIGQLVSLSSGLRLWSRVEDYQASCVEGGYLYDQQLHPWSSIFRERLPLQDDVQTHSLSFSQEDVEGRISQYTNVLQQCAHQTTFDDEGHHLLGLFEQFSAPKTLSHVLPLRDGHRVYRQFAAELNHHVEEFECTLYAGVSLDRCPWVLSHGVERRLAGSSLKDQVDLPSLDVKNQGSSTQEFFRGTSHIAKFYPFQHPPLVGGRKITCIVPIGLQPIIDAKVENVNNYKAGGCFHHNCGKTLAGAFEMSIHLTGRYPDWWNGKKFTQPIRAIAGSDSAELTRRGVQRLLVGNPEDRQSWGTGAVPKEALVSWQMRAGVADALASLTVKHTSGGNSTVQFASYEQGRQKWQADSVQVIWLDEECQEEIYSEAITRTNATKGIVYMTMTPLFGMSEVVRRFLIDPTPDRADICMTIDDAGHYSEEEKERIKASYQPYEIESRLNGVPMMGSGRIFPIVEDTITCDAFEVPGHWPQIIGLDFGWDHPTAAARLAWDRDTDTIYVTAIYKKKEATPIYHAAAIKQWGDWIPVAWPHDGLQHDKGSGDSLRDQYKAHGLKMLPDKATHPPGDGEAEGQGGNGVEAGLMEMLDRMQTGRWQVFSHLTEWFEEFRLYHRDNGRVIKQYDDALSASRYAMMMIRHARVKSKAKTKPIKINRSWVV